MNDIARGIHQSFKDIENKGGLKDLDSRGFVVIPGFLSEAELKEFENDINAQEITYNMNYRLKYFSDKLIDLYRDKFLQLAQSVSNNTENSKTNTVGVAVYFSTEKGQNFLWHQDHETYYVSQTGHDSLNLYIPIIKPNKNKSNLSIIPFDSLKEKSPEVHAKVFGAGASRWRIHNGKTVVRNDSEGGKIGVLDYDIDDIAETPELNAGDLLLLRGDIIHRTQDSDTLRVAASVRLVNNKLKVTKAKLASGGLIKSFVMMRNKHNYIKMFDSFKVANKDELELKELLDYLDGPAKAKSQSNFGFILSLLGHRLKARKQTTEQA